MRNSRKIKIRTWSEGEKKWKIYRNEMEKGEKSLLPSNEILSVGKIGLDYDEWSTVTDSPFCVGLSAC